MTRELDCQEVSRLISDGLDEALPPAERTRLRLHFVICRTCREVNEQMQFLRRAMRRLGKPEPPPQAPPGSGTGPDDGPKS